MNRTLFRIVLSVVMAMGLASVASAQIGIGLRDTHYIYVDYTLKDKYYARFEQSVFAEKIPCQYFRVKLGFQSKVIGIKYSIQPFFGHTYNKNYWNVGADLSASGEWKRFGASAGVTPLYDSGYGYKTCFMVGARLRLTDPMWIMAEYTTIPEYRISEQRLRGGFIFNYKKFHFNPMVSVPVSGNNKFKSLRVIANFHYQF